MSDLISKADTLEMLDKKLIELDGLYLDGNRDAFFKSLGVNWARMKIGDMPSAEPEIIYCAECRYYTKEIGWNGSKHMVCSEAGRYQSLVKADDFCSRAERRKG